VLRLDGGRASNYCFRRGHELFITVERVFITAKPHMSGAGWSAEDKDIELTKDAKSLFDGLGINPMACKATKKQQR
jgi:hypothetical protein